MAQITVIKQALKLQLKAAGLNYKSIAKNLELSEASVKRLLSDNSASNLSLERLEQLCQCFDMSISEFMRLIDDDSHKISVLNKAQEKAIVEDVSLLLVTVCVLNRWSFAHIAEFYTFSHTELIQKLATLDKLNIIELGLNNKINLKVANNFQWIDDGPIQQFFQKSIANEFFNTRFQQDNETLIVLNGMLSSTHSQYFKQQLQKLGKQFEQLNKEDANSPFDQRHGQTVVLAMRDWKYGLFSSFKAS